MRSRFTAVALVMGFVLSAAIAADWPGFRGSRGGVADDMDLPVKWTQDNILYKIKLPGLGTSSPIISGDKVFVTCYAGYGTKITKGFTGFGKGGFGKGKGKGKGKGGLESREGQKNLKLLLVCLERKDGKIVWQKEIQPKLPEMSFASFIREHGYASSTPVTDGKAVYVFFGKTGVLAFDMSGKKLWQADVGSGTHQWGSAASPILYKDLVIVNAAVESDSLVALDKKSGREVWRVKDVGTSWASPLLVRTLDGKDEVVVSQYGKVVGYDPEKGTTLWHCQGVGGGGGGGFGGFGGFAGYTCSTPVSREGIVYLIGGGGPTPTVALAIKAGGRGDVNKSHVLWRKNLGSATCSPLLCGKYLCWVSGTVVALNAADGKVAFQKRLYNAWGEYVSAVAAGDKIFALTRFDGLFVLDASNFEQLAHNTFPGDESIFNASPAISDGRIYIRSNEYLYCIGKKGKN